jgi:hypothetical protein
LLTFDDPVARHIKTNFKTALLPNQGSYHFRPGTAGVCIYPEVEPHRSKQKQLMFSKLGTLFDLMLRQGTPRTVKQTALLLNLVNYDI